MADHCNHIYDYYQRKVTDRRRKRLKCNRLEDMAVTYSLRAAGYL
jgi:hypothetical protein